MISQRIELHNTLAGRARLSMQGKRWGGYNNGIIQVQGHWDEVQV